MEERALLVERWYRRRSKLASSTQLSNRLNLLQAMNVCFHYVPFFCKVDTFIVHYKIGIPYLGRPDVGRQARK